MKLTLIYFDFMEGAEGKYYEGIASISAVLKNNAHAVKLFHITKRISCNEFLGIFDKEFGDTEIAAFSATTNIFYYVSLYSRELKKKYKNIFTICGGVHPTLSPEDSIREEGLDAICIGEGEYPLLELCSMLEEGRDIYHIQNIWLKKSGKVIENSVRPLIENLDSLPMPDRDIFNYDISMDRKMNRVVFMGSRGCPYQCTYCCNHSLKMIYPNPSFFVRYKSPDKFLKEIKYCLKKYRNIGHVNFQDDIFTLNRDWFKKFVTKYSQEIGLPYICNSRFDLLNADVVTMLKDTGCFEIRVGLESGDDFIRKDVLGRKQNKEQMLEVSRLCKEKGIRIYLFTMVGFPFENMRRVLNTIKLTSKLHPAVIQTSIFYPYPKTSLYNICKEKGFLSDKHLDSYFKRDSVLNLSDFSIDTIVFAYDNFINLTRIYRLISNLPRVFNSVFERLLDSLILALVRFPMILKSINFSYPARRKLYHSIKRYIHFFHLGDYR